MERDHPDISDIAAKVAAGVRLAREDGIRLLHHTDILELGSLANLVRERKNGNLAYFSVNRHINYTNECRNGCRFCAFSRRPGGGYVLSVEDVLAKAREAEKSGVRELHIVGGTHPDLRLNYYVEMLRRLREEHPTVCLQAFTAVEIANIAEREGLSYEHTLRALRDAGLTAIPGGGAEVFSERVRKLVCPEKLPGEKWLDLMRAAHRLGIPSNATMLYGHVETAEERIDHLLRLRELQDETGGFLAFVPLPFHPENTALAHLPPTTAFDDLRTIAVSRLMLDNFPHIKAFWIMLGEKLAQVSLSFGADDLDGTVVEEQITHSAGAKTPQGLAKAELVNLIRGARRVPVERDTIYNTVQSW